MDTEDVAKVAVVVAVVGALVFIISNDPDVDSIGWVLFVVGVVVAVIAACVIMLSRRRH